MSLWPDKLRHVLPRPPTHPPLLPRDGLPSPRSDLTRLEGGSQALPPHTWESSTHPHRQSIPANPSTKTKTRDLSQRDCWPQPASTHLSQMVKTFLWLTTQGTAGTTEVSSFCEGWPWKKWPVRPLHHLGGGAANLAAKLSGAPPKPLPPPPTFSSYNQVSAGRLVTKSYPLRSLYNPH